MTATHPVSPLRTAIVTGAAHGIGLGITQRLLRDGWTIFAVDQDEARLETMVPESPAAAPRLHRIAADVSDEASVRRAVDRAHAISGRLDGLVCNAGVMIRKPLGTLSLTEWNRVLAVNLTGTFLLARAASPLLRAGREGGAPGAIVTIGSTRAHMSEPDTESYSASKGGLVALTHALAISLGPEIRVNCISPGWIDVTGESLRPRDHAQHPAGRVGTVQDVASLAAWLLGPGSGFVTGSEFVVDGGMTRRMLYVE